MDINQNEEELDRKLFDALYHLMQTRTIEELSVGDILKRANVSRSSFYRRYPDKYELLIRSYGRLLDSTFMRCMRGADWRKSSIQLYSVIMGHPAFFKHAFQYTGQNNLKQYICDVILSCMRERCRQNGVDLDADWKLCVAAESFLYGSMESTARWAIAGMPYPADELIELINDIMPEALKQHCL